MVCHRQNLNDKLNDELLDETIAETCHRKNVMVGCKQRTSSMLAVVAWSSRETALLANDTSSVSCGGNGRVSDDVAYERCMEYIVGNACCNADAREEANKKCKPKGDAEVSLAGTKNLGWLLGVICFIKMQFFHKTFES